MRLSTDIDNRFIDEIKTKEITSYPGNSTVVYSNLEYVPLVQNIIENNKEKNFVNIKIKQDFEHKYNTGFLFHIASEEKKTRSTHALKSYDELNDFFPYNLPVRLFLELQTHEIYDNKFEFIITCKMMDVELDSKYPDIYTYK
jgi:hypothetical protein